MLAVVVVIVGVAMGGSAFAAYRYDRAHAEHILPGVRIAGLDVGGMTRAEATGVVQEQADEWLSEKLTVTAGKETWSVTPEELGVSADVAPAVDDAFGIASGYSWMSRAYHRLSDDPVGGDFDIDWSFNKTKATNFVDDAAGSVLRKPADAAVEINDRGGLTFVKPHTGVEIDPTASMKHIRMALSSQRSEVELPLHKVQPKVTSKNLGYTIVVDLSQNKLTLYEGFKVDRTYGVATAQPGFETPLGTWEIVNKVANPAWINPAPNGWGSDSPDEIPPGPGNPLGTRAMYLDADGIRIHGTYDSASIGTYASHGCIRMTIGDSEQLYKIVPIGTPVLIIK